MRSYAHPPFASPHLVRMRVVAHENARGTCATPGIRNALAVTRPACGRILDLRWGEFYSAGVNAAIER